jgi:hypothetical protein
MSNFYTDVIMQSPSFNSSKRVSDIELLEPVTRQKVLDIIADAKTHGIELMVFETYRSQKRQEELFKQGASKLQKVGAHHYGLACDIVKSIKGDPSWKGDFSLLGQLAHEHGLVWGGDWGNPAVPHTFIDEVHVQRCTVAKQATLFRGEWYPDEAYDPYAG